MKVSGDYLATLFANPQSDISQRTRSCSCISHCNPPRLMNYCINFFVYIYMYIWAKFVMTHEMKMCWKQETYNVLIR